MSGVGSGERERWQRVEEIFDRVVDRPEGERAAALDRECEGDPELRAEVEELLRADAAEEGLLDRPIGEAAAKLLGEVAGSEEDERRSAAVDDLATVAASAAAAAAASASLPASVGGYEIVGKLGEGGMGAVYEALQTSPRRRVALKVVRGGRFVSDGAVRMFQREVDTLARLKHPNIGAIYESGRTDDGQHFFAMELVRGVTLAEYLARDEGPLSRAEIDRRLDLFRSIADAVHYAHQRGVVHRDLKPSNIVVTERHPAEDESGSGSGLPRVKILDFGLARITEGDVAAASMVTEVGIIKGTLPYMSPEQARGDSLDIDLRTDVYALGVILYEMLSARRPYDLERGSIADAVRVICETPPRPLRQVWRGRHKLNPDLETIVGTALDKEKDRRYASAAALSEDVARLQAHQPILARPPSTAYQIRKLVARNKLGAAFLATLLVLIVGFGVWMNVLWRRSEAARAQAQASGLLTLGRFEIDESPSSALAYALASLELADGEAARRFALEALWRGPPARVFSSAPVVAPSFSPDGRYLAIDSVNLEKGEVLLALLRAEGGEPQVLSTFPPSPADFTGFDAASRRLFSHREGFPLQVWSVPDGELLESREVGEHTVFLRRVVGESLISVSGSGPDPESVEGWSEYVSRVRSWPVEGGGPRELGLIKGHPFRSIWVQADLDSAGSRLVHTDGVAIYVQSLDGLGPEVEAVGEHPEGPAVSAFFRPGREVVGSVSPSGQIQLAKLAGGSLQPHRSLSHGPLSFVAPLFDPSGRYLAAGNEEGEAWFWDLEAPPDAGPIVLRRSGQQHIVGLAFDPGGRWLATGDNASGSIWPLARHVLELRGHTGTVTAVAFDPRGRWLVSSGGALAEGRVWPLEGDTRGWPLEDLAGRSVAVHPSGERFLTSFDTGVRGKGAALVPVAGGGISYLGGVDAWSAAFSRDGRYAAAAGGQFVEEGAVVNVWDLETGEAIVLDAGDGKMVADVVFLGPHRIAAAGISGLRVWDLEERTYETLEEGPHAYLAATADGETLLGIAGPGTWAAQGGVVRVHDLASGESRVLESHGGRVVDVAVDAEGSMVVTGDAEGVVRVGPLSGEEPHLLLGHDDIVHAVAIDPLGRWIASGGVDRVIRLWPMPQGRPFHTLPREEILDRLRGATNYRVVPDAGVPTGYRLEIGPFQGWESIPDW